MTIPSRITEEARKLAAKLVFEFETRVQSGEFNDPAGDQASVTLENLVLGALVEFGIAAEQRGREMEWEDKAAKVDEMAAKARQMSKDEFQFNKFERRDFDSMSIAYVQAAAAIRSRTTEG